jgi:hypothetical protein
MARDHSPKIRQRAQLERKQSQRASYDRVLIVSEGSKTEPLYFKEIKNAHRLQTANVEVHPSALGTEPIQVVRYAKQLFEAGDTHKRVRAKAFEKVFAIFDRDDHKSYFDALRLVGSLDGKLRNDAKQPVEFKAIASVPCFELWLLLHFEDIRHPLHRDEVLTRLKLHMPGYAKGAGGSFATTKASLDIASQRARKLAALSTAFDDTEPSTDIVELVALLIEFVGQN